MEKDKPTDYECLKPWRKEWHLIGGKKKYKCWTLKNKICRACLKFKKCQKREAIMVRAGDKACGAINRIFSK